MKPYIISIFVNTSKDGQDIMLFYRTNCIDKLQQFEQEVLIKRPLLYQLSYRDKNNAKSQTRTEDTRFNRPLF